MSLSETEDFLLIPFEHFCDSVVGLFRADLSIAEISIDGLPILWTKVTDEDIPHVPNADRPIEIAEN